MSDSDKKVIYEIFAPAWLGGLKAMEEHLYRIKKLSIDYVWITPIFESPQMDAGYDVSDYYKIDPRYGTMDDFVNFVNTAHRLGIRILLDLVLNHTSTECAWFKESASGSGWYKDFYLWIGEGSLEARKLRNWRNFFDGGSVLRESEERDGEYYFSFFSPSQADLNWWNPRVIEEFGKIIDFWIKKGVDGFRLDSVPFLIKDIEDIHLPKPVRDFLGAYAEIPHCYMKDKTIEVLHELFDKRRSEKGIFVIGEAGIPLKRFAKRLAGPEGPLDATLNIMVPNAIDHYAMLFDGAPVSVDRLMNTVASWSKLPYYVASIESHDTPRMTSRAQMRGDELLRRMLDCDPQMICLYQGQAMGVENPRNLSRAEMLADVMTKMQFDALTQSGMTEEAALAQLRETSRANARRRFDLIDYERQMRDSNSCVRKAARMLTSWKGE